MRDESHFITRNYSERVVVKDLRGPAGAEGKAAGISDFILAEEEISLGNLTYTAVQTVQGWGLMNPDSAFN